MSSSLQQWQAENQATQARISELKGLVEAQRIDIARADERARELHALRSATLLKHLRQHAEEAEQTRILEQTRKGIQQSWERIRSLQERNAEVIAQQAREKAFDAQQSLQRDEHFKSAAKAEACATLPERLLETECDELIVRLRAEDDERERQEAEHARRLAEAEEASAAEATAAAESAAMQHDDTPLAADGATASLERAILEALSAKGQADTATILAYLSEPAHHYDSVGGGGEGSLDAATVERALERLQEEWAVFEMVPGWYTRF